MIRCLTTRGGPQERLVPTAFFAEIRQTGVSRMHPPNFPAMSKKQVKRVERTFVITSYYSLSRSRWYEKGSETSQEIHSWRMPIVQ